VRPFSVLLAAVLFAPVGPNASAQTPTQALAQKWDTICATAVNGTTLFVRCDETATSIDPNANLTAALGQHIDEIPGHIRVATRDVETSPGGFQATGVERLGVLASGAPATLYEVEARMPLAPRWSLFASLESGRVTRRDSPHEAAFDAGTGHATVGVNRQLGRRLLAGAAWTQDSENLDYRGSDSSADAGYHGWLGFLDLSMGEAWGLQAYAGSTQGRIDLVRAIHYVLPRVGGGDYVVDALATARPGTRRGFQGIELDWNRSGGAWQRDLSLGYDQTRTRIDGYTESGGAGLGLVVPDRSVQTRRGRFDARFGRTFSEPWGVWQPSLRVGWREEFGNPSRKVSVRLVQDLLNNRISFDTEDPDRGWGELALGSVFTFTHGRSAFVEYRQRFAHAFLEERVLAVGWRMEL
jgi:hypothetical protein